MQLVAFGDGWPRFAFAHCGMDGEVPLVLSVAHANKLQISQAVETLFDVKVLEVNTIKLRSKERRYGRYVGRESGYKKALVKLAPGNTIKFFEGV